MQHVKFFFYPRIFIFVQVQHFKDFIPAAFPTGSDLILDAEVLLVDNNTGNPLPFGTLGVHKVCYSFVNEFMLHSVYSYGENVLSENN